jgi:hypothetical protein
VIPMSDEMKYEMKKDLIATGIIKK